MEIRHIQKNIHTTPRKLRLVADMVRSLTPQQAVAMLALTNKAAAAPLSGAIKTALAGIKMQSQDLAKFYFKSLEVNEGPAMKRFRAGTRGRAKPYKKRTSQIRVILSDELVVGSQNETIEKKTKEVSGGTKN